MIDVKTKKCQKLRCTNLALYGETRALFCNNHKTKNMINYVLENKCTIIDCDEEYEFTIDNIKYCYSHHPDLEKNEIKIKRLCKYCDLVESSTHTCGDCKKIKSKKEWSVVRFLRKVINIHFDYNTNKMLNGCSRKRPDIYFELAKHCVIVEFDENQHNGYGDLCECARLCEMVGSIGGKTVIVIRYNPDKIYNNKKEVIIPQDVRLELLVKTINEYLTKDISEFQVKLIQLFYNDNYKKYKEIKEEDITKIVCV